MRIQLTKKGTALGESFARDRAVGEGVHPGDSDVEAGWEEGACEKGVVVVSTDWLRSTRTLSRRGIEPFFSLAVLL